MKTVIDMSTKVTLDGQIRDEMNKKMMFDEKQNDIKYGGEKLNEYINIFKQCEEFLHDEMLKYPTAVIYDVSALEQPYFDTVGYTNFSELFMMYPLSPEMKMNQIQDCFINPEPCEIDYYEHFNKKYNSEQDLGKYEQSSEISVISDFDVVVTLPGGNKLNTLCINKAKHIIREYGTKAIFKIHPMIVDREIKQIIDSLPLFATIIPGNEPLYEYIKKVDKVYTTHSSESAFLAACMGKEIEPVDTFQSTKIETFSHINHFLFYSENKRDVINKILNNYRSGVIHPILDENWKEKITLYLEYLHTKRSMVKNFFIGG